MTVLPAAEAFTEGSELWIIPDRRSSYWSRRIDWHLQFLISRSMIHETPQISEELKRIVRDNEIDNKLEEPSKIAPLLIFSVDLLPNRETVHLPFEKNFRAWIERASDIWIKLKKPTVRVFLPESQDLEDFKSFWPEVDGISVVADPKGAN